MSFSDALGYRGQQAVAQAVAERGDYHIIGGHMVRTLLHVYLTANAVLRSTTDADAALGSIEVVEPVTQNLIAENFTKEGGNILFKVIGADQRIEITRKNAGFPVPKYLNRLRFAALISRHVA